MGLVGQHEGISCHYLPLGSACELTTSSTRSGTSAMPNTERALLRVSCTFFKVSYFAFALTPSVLINSVRTVVPNPDSSASFRTDQFSTPIAALIWIPVIILKNTLLTPFCVIYCLFYAIKLKIQYLTLNFNAKGSIFNQSTHNQVGTKKAARCIRPAACHSQNLKESTMNSIKYSRFSVCFKHSKKDFLSSSASKPLNAQVLGGAA